MLCRSSPLKRCSGLEPGWMMSCLTSPPTPTRYHTPYCSQMAVTQVLSRARPRWFPIILELMRFLAMQRTIKLSEAGICWLYTRVASLTNTCWSTLLSFSFFNDSFWTTISSGKPDRPTTYRNRSPYVLLSGHAKNVYTPSTLVR